MGSFELINLLELDESDRPETIRSKYHGLLRKYERILRSSSGDEYTSTKSRMIHLMQLYSESDHISVSEVVECAYDRVGVGKKTTCRCGAEYKTEEVGIVGCEWCSCYIVVEKVVVIDSKHIGN
ncbi:hypothetical protein ECANGB1_2799 [Enterospora canceri]|uniref:Uncharacterized protein n=1 Tax=Enterospora canceri TaxID=1081671 RepID=A0A1Y1S5N1_9MICR|nr:hypothetical protein ECANGB1_2799 [Enterospora canceri]